MGVFWQQLIVAALVCVAIVFLTVRYLRSRHGKGDCYACRAGMLRRKAESARKN